MSKSVLIIEDDKLLAEVYQKSLQSEGIKTSLAHDSTSAVQKFSPVTTSLVVLDIILDQDNGFELIKQFRKQNGAEKVPIIVVTGLNTDEIGINKELMVSLNIVGIFTKSQFAVSKLVEVVKYGLIHYAAA